MRITHEAQQHQEKCFLTLTLDDDHLVGRYLLGHDQAGVAIYGGTLVKKHFQDFMKRLRKRTGRELQYYHCGEYGERKRRPHYHAILFGYEFPDAQLYRVKNGHRLFTSQLLDEIWGHGGCTIGAVTFETAAYCARYVTKKITGELAERHYQGVDQDSGEVIRLLPEYSTMSLKRPIGKSWFAQFRGDVFPHDEVIMRGREMKPPRYYDKLLEELDQIEFQRIKEARKAAATANRSNSTAARLAVREEVKIAQLKQLKREIE